jgi:hypothetical protein
MTPLDDVVVPLNPALTFGPENATLIGRANTTYTSNYDSNHYSILNITDSKLFTIEGGILKYGSLFGVFKLDYYFMIVNGTGGASLRLLGVMIEFVSAMNSTVFILGGKVTLKDVTINNQLNTNWVSPLVFSESSISSVIIDLHSCTITNSGYKNANSSLPRSAVVYFTNRTTATQSIVLNMSFCLCLNNTFNLSITNLGGGVSVFRSYNESSCMCISFLIKNGKEKRN